MEQDKMMFLGKTVTDRITGFSGIVTGYVQYISGCNQVLIVPPVDGDGKLRDAEWFDEQRIEIHEVDAVTLDNDGHEGFDKAAPKR